MKKNIIIIIGVIALGVLCGVYYAVRCIGESVSENEMIAQNEIPYLSNLKDVVRIGITVQDKSEIFQKKEDNWECKTDSLFSVNNKKMKDIIEQLKNLLYIQKIDTVQDLREYDLEQPTKKLILVDGDGNEADIYIGKQPDSSMQQYYIRMNEDKNNVYVVELASLSDVCDDLYTLAEREEIPEFQNEEVKKLQVKRDNLRYEISSETGMADEWEVQCGTSVEKADSEKIENLISSLNNSIFEKCVNYECTDLEKYGLKNPYGNLTVYYNDNGEEKRWDLQIGDECKGGRYANTGNSKMIYQISTKVIDKLLNTKPSSFYDLVMCYEPLEKIEKITIEYNEETKEVVAGDIVHRETADEDLQKNNKLYYIDGNAIDDIDFKTFYSVAVNQKAETYLTNFEVPETEKILSIQYTLYDGSAHSMEYYSYDDQNYYGVKDGEKGYLVNKMDIKQLITLWEKIS